MNTFAFVIHPIDPKRDALRKFPRAARLFSEGQISFLSTFFPPLYISEITGVRSQSTGAEIKGWFVACPLTPSRILHLPESWVYRKIIGTGRLAEKLGAQILGLGAYTSVVGDAGISIARALDIPVTTGDAYTAAVAVQAVKEASHLLDIPLQNMSMAILGATGAIGRACSQILARSVGEINLISRREAVLESLRKDLIESGATAHLYTHTGLAELSNAHMILALSSTPHALIYPEHLQPGTVIFDVASPHDASRQIAESRQDVLVIDGGIVDVPGEVDFHFDFGLPAGKAFACMAETMALALDGRLEDYTLGRKISPQQVLEIEQIAEKHGFRLSEFQSFGQPIPFEKVERVRDCIRRRLTGRECSDSFSLKKIPEPQKWFLYGMHPRS